MNGVQRYLAPTALAAALDALAHPGGVTVLAGGTDLMPQSHARRVPSRPTLLNIRRVEGLDRVAVEGDRLVLGALVTITTLLEHPLVRAHAPLLAVAADRFASAQVRNAATLGGNLCNASPAADSAPALICYGASAHIFGPDGHRRLPLEQFFLGPGKTALQRGELLTGVTVPFVRGAAGHFLKLGRTAVGDISLMNVAVLGWPDSAAPSGSSWRIALGSVAPTVIRAPEAERLLSLDTSPAGLEAASQAAAAAARPIDDIRATAAYRTDMVRVLTRRGVERVLAEISGK